MASRTLLFCTSFMQDEAAWKTRYRRWLDHHLAIPWKVDAVAMIDDGSPFLPQPGDIELIPADALGKVALPRRALIRFADNLGRQATLRYPGWWRSFQLSLDLAELYGFDKIVHVESDSYVLSMRMVELIENTKEGWTLFWSAHFQWPETALQIICRDAFEDFARIRARGPNGWVDQPAEDVLPYTRVEKSLIGDRYSDFAAMLPANADYAVQVVPAMTTVVPVSWSRRLKYKTLAQASGTLAPLAGAFAIHDSSSDAAALRDSAIAAYQRGDFESAIAGLEEAVARSPGEPEGHKFLAAALMQVGRVQDAIRQAERALVLAPRDAGLLNMLGAFYAAIDDGERALQHWQRAIELNPADPTPLGNMQSVEARLGLPATASAKARQFIVASLCQDLTHGAFSRPGLITLLDLWDVSSASPSEMHAVLTVARETLTHVVGKEARGLARLAMASGDVALATFYTEPLAKAPHAGNEDRLALAELMIAAGGADWQEGWQAADRARRALHPDNYLAGDATFLPLGAIDSLLIYQDGDAREALIGLRFVEQISSQGARIVVWLEPATRAMVAEASGALALSRAASRPLPEAEGCARSIALFSLIARCCSALEPGHLPAAQDAAFGPALEQNPTGVLRVSVRRPDPMRHGHAAEVYLRFVSALLARGGQWPDGVQFDMSEQLPASRAGWLTQADVVISDDAVSAFVAAGSSRPVWLMTAPAIDWRLRMGQRDHGWWPNLRLLQPMEGAEADAMASRVWTELSERQSRPGAN